MRKLFTLTLALLASFSLWAALPTLPTSTLTIPNFPASGWKGIMLPSVIDTTDNWYIVSPYEIYQSAFSWSNTAGGGSSDGTWAATGIFPANTRYTTTDSKGKFKFATLKEFDSKKHYYGYRVTNCEAVALIGASGSNKKRTIYLAAYEITNSTLPDSANATKTASFESSNLTQIMIEDLDATKEYYIYVTQKGTGSGGSSEGNSNFYSIAFKSAPSCEDSESTIKGDTTLYVNNGYNIGFNSINTNGCTIDVKKNGAAAVDDVDYSKTNINNYTFLKAGEFVITISQAKDANNHCAVEESVTVTVLDATPVAAVTVAGETNAYVGAELTYTATAANATAYEWYLDDVKQGSDSAKFIYTAVKGSHTIVCKARNEFNVDPYPEWIASVAKEVTITNPSGTLITYTLTGGTVNNANIPVGANNIVGGTANAQTEAAQKGPEGDKGYKLGSAGHFIQLTLASGSFLAGDTVCVYAVPEDKDVLSTLTISSDKDKTDVIGSATGLTNETSKPAKIVLTKGATDVYLSRPTKGDQNPVVKYMSVIRPKEIKSVTENLSNVKIDGEAISSDNLTTLLADESLDIAESYLDAPEVKFYKTIRTTYEDDTYTDKLDSIVVTSTTEAGKWQAQATINEVEYTITMAKTPSYSVTYKLGSRTLGSELVIANGNPADYEDYQTIDNNGLSTFVNWYSRSDLSGDAVTMASATITKDTTFYAKFNIKYASSINMEQWILDNGAGKGSSTKTDALIAEMNSRNYSTNIAWSNDSKEEIELDSLDDGKTSRNEPYLGLKVKKSGKLINFRLKEGEYVKVKFGQVNTTPKVAINGGDYTAMTITDNVYTYNATGEDLVSIYIDVAKQAVVYKQIMINEEIQDVTLPDTPTAIDNTADEIKAVKFVENGQLFIRRGEKVYTITGEEVK